MCHGNLKVEFDIHNNNCFYVGGPNGSEHFVLFVFQRKIVLGGKSALFSAINIGLGGGGKSNDRGNSVKQYKWQKVGWSPFTIINRIAVAPR